MNWRIVLSDLRVTKDQLVAVEQVLTSGWLSMGPWTARFEGQFAADAGVEHAVAVASATSGLLLALQSCGVGVGDEVVLPSLTFVADANVVRSLGATPVFADIESPLRPIVTAEAVHAAVTPLTRAVIIVHYGGYQAPVDALSDLRATGVRVIEDAAHAVGPVAEPNQWLSLRGDLAVYSFFANKNLPTGEGGMVTTADPELAGRIRSLRNHGMTTGTWDRHRGHASDYDVTMVGGNHRPQEVSAALGVTGLADLADHNARRRAHLAHYRQCLADLDPSGDRASLVFSADEATAGHLAVVALPPGRRPEVRTALAEAGIQSSFHYPPIHRFTAYLDYEAALPQTEAAAERLVTLPLHPWLTQEDVDETCRIVVRR